MQIMRFAIVGLLIAMGVSFAESGHLSLKLTALDSQVKTGTRIMVRVTTTNNSDRPITYYNTNPGCDYSLRVLTAGGAPAPETPFKKQTSCDGGNLGITGRNIRVSLKPGESSSEDILITDLYDMSRPGEYTVQVDRAFPDIGRLTSNIAKISVTQ